MDRRGSAPIRNKIRTFLCNSACHGHNPHPARPPFPLPPAPPLGLSSPLLLLKSRHTQPIACSADVRYPFNFRVMRLPYRWKAGGIKIGRNVLVLLNVTRTLYPLAFYLAGRYRLALAWEKLGRGDLTFCFKTVRSYRFPNPYLHSYSVRRISCVD